MHHLGTLMMALDLLHTPSRARQIRSVPLPDGVVTLLRIADGDEPLTRQAAAATGASAAFIREAVDFFIEQALLFPEADAYRVLGAQPEASTAELRRNMALLMRWLHPDHGPQERSVFAHRVTRAWNDLKTDDRRAAYDRSRRMALSEKSLSHKKAKSILQSQTPFRRPRNIPPRAMSSRPVSRAAAPSSLLRRVLLLLLGRAAY